MAIRIGNPLVNPWRKHVGSFVDPRISCASTQGTGGGWLGR